MSFSALPPPPLNVPHQRGKQRWQPAARSLLVGSSAAVVCALGRSPARAASSSDKHSYWAQVWTEGRIAFHRPAVNEALLKHAPAFLEGEKHTVLVPLCGKTLDLAWLAKHAAVSAVVGVEVIKQAVDAFAKEHPECKLRAVKSSVPAYSYALSDAKSKLTLWCGDIFDLPQDGRFTRVWDRASLIALDPSTRAKYVQAISGTLAPGGVILLQTLERVAGPADLLKAGPPFSVTDAQVKQLYGAQYEILKLDESEALSTAPHLQQRGLTSLLSRNYLLTKKK